MALIEGLEPHEIEGFLKKHAVDGDPYAGMTPDEINAYLANISLPKLDANARPVVAAAAAGGK